MSKKEPISRYLVWMDCEMTGLDPEKERLIEIATIITDNDLEIVAQGPVIAIHQSDEQLAGMDKWNRRQHKKTGLIERVKASSYDDARAETETLDFLKQYLTAGESPLCGNSIGQDRRFLVKYMPTLAAFFHYRNLDVSTLKELAKRWRPDIYKQMQKKSTHQALDDIIESIDELKLYRALFLNVDSQSACELCRNH